MAWDLVQVYFDEEVKAITDLVDKLSQYGPSHEEVARSTASLLDVKLLLIRNSIEARAVKHLVKEGGWTGSVLMLLTKGSDDKDFESAVEEIQASGVADYKVVVQVDYNARTLSGPDPCGRSASNVLPKPDSEPLFHGAVVSGGQSSAMGHGRRVRPKTEGTFRPVSSIDEYDQILECLKQRVQALEAAVAPGGQHAPKV